MSCTDVKGYIFDIQKFSVNDGPGIRTTVFLKGCPLRCMWCHNPESYSRDTDIFYVKAKCVLCMSCAGVCRHGCHSLKDNEHIFNREKCIRCGACADVCLTKALERVGRLTSVADCMKEIDKDKVFYESSGGGITISGGEPLYQPEFTVSLAKAAKESGYTVCIETSGFGKTEDILELAKYTDVFLFDYKYTGADHEKYIGAKQDIILTNLRAIDDMGSSIILRCPIIKDINMNEEHFNGIEKLASTLKHVLKIELEPYHPLGISKSDQIGIVSRYKDTFLDRRELVASAKLIQEHTGIPTNFA